MKRISAIVLALMFSPAVVNGQTPAASPAPPSGPQAAAPAAKAEAVNPLEPQGFSYNPEGRRDPFVSLLRRGADTRSTSASRPPGLPGLSVSEVSLRGTIASRGSYVGILQGVDSKTYIARAGDRLLDGTIRSISADAMVVLQQVNDPLSLEKQREVRKALRQIEDAK